MTTKHRTGTSGTGLDDVDLGSHEACDATRVRRRAHAGAAASLPRQLLEPLTDVEASAGLE